MKMGIKYFHYLKNSTLLHHRKLLIEKEMKIKIGQRSTLALTSSLEQKKKMLNWIKSIGLIRKVAQLIV
jgi:hypothetical protein